MPNPKKPLTQSSVVALTMAGWRTTITLLTAILTTMPIAAAGGTQAAEAGAVAGLPDPAPPYVRSAWRFGTVRDQPAEAAAAYRRAMALYDTLPEADKTRLAFYPDPAPDDGKQVVLLPETSWAIVRQAMEEMIRGAQYADCEWDIKWPAGPFVPAPALPEAWNADFQRLRVVALAARYAADRHLDADRPGEAVRVLLAATMMGRHTERAGALLGGLVGLAMRAIARGPLAEVSPRLPVAWLPEILAAEDALAQTCPVSAGRALRSERRRFLDRFARQLHTSPDAARTLRALFNQSVGHPGRTPYRLAAPARRDDPAYWRAILAGAAETLNAAAEIVDGPGARAEQLERIAVLENSMGWRPELLPGGWSKDNLTQVRRAYVREAVERAMLRAGFACLATPERERWPTLPEMRSMADETGIFVVEPNERGFMVKPGDPERYFGTPFVRMYFGPRPPGWNIAVIKPAADQTPLFVAPLPAPPPDEVF